MSIFISSSLRNPRRWKEIEPYSLKATKETVLRRTAVSFVALTGWFDPPGQQRYVESRVKFGSFPSNFPRAGERLVAAYAVAPLAADC
jgi:hypothetical protein